ncbi:enoyl-CoA hydratase-related protein [Nocardioides albus]|uniref:Enoyl-CoA hydratase/carnithine racemase n=1 Tax=Nocardioides albus TaxID=1841 RepID=A0A7W5A3U5_9ACTN|nr:enoyl-CoA hydratase-related protein [Nocardioides albus]MBB3088984.1 enoyl-CoA hydratase/carnithine racemase [Nocardioides albus]GGU15017.1 enoyl-CoA hydratase [Nocardioides albus]
MSDSAGHEVLYEISDGVVTLTLNRPDRSNGWTPALQTRLYGLLDEMADDPDVRVVIITGAGRAFCAGADMEMLSAEDPGTGESSRPLLAPMWFPKPIVAAINGACAGLGLQLALMCDYRVASSQAKFTTAFSRRGLIAEHGLTWLLPRLTSLATASELLISARIFRGAEAERLGVVHRAVEPDQVLSDAYAYARDLADNVSPTSMGVIKWQMYNHYDRPLLESMDHSDQLMAESAERPDFAEGVSSFIERRPPKFPPLQRSAVPPMTFTSPT